MGKRINLSQQQVPLISCKFREEDQFVFLDFGHITKQKKYCYEALLEKQKNDPLILQSFFRMIVEMSQLTWAELAHRSKFQIGGYEPLSLWKFNVAIWDQLDPTMTEDVKLLVFRFGKGQAYRMIGYKSSGCRHALHILGFDLDYSLYDHGN